MTTSDMNTILGDRMEDSAGDLFSTTVKERYLNRAQDKLIQALNPHLLTDLHVLVTGISMRTDNDVDSHFKSYFIPTQAQDLASDPFGGPLGILGVRIASSNFIRKISFDMAKDFSTGLVSFSGTEPVYFIFKGRIYIYNNTANVDCYYIKTPATLASAPEQNCELNAIFHDAILEFAEAELWRTVNQPDRMNNALTRAYEYVGRYNQNPATSVVGEGIPFDYTSSNSLIDPIYPNYPVG
jgi:hypothetical protein